jgi:creatinine amidohydrolase
MPVYLERITWQEFRRLVPDSYRVALLPVGTIEGHGVCALGTDSLIPTDLAAEIADDLPAIICPTIPYGEVKGLSAYPGSVPVRGDVFRAYLEDVLTSLAQQGFERIIVLNGHGGNTNSLNDAAYAAFTRTNKKFAVIDWWYLATPVCEEVFGEAGGHAGADENGYILALDPAMVNEDDYDESLVHQISPGVTTYPYPGPVLTYKDGEGAPVFDREKAQRYRKGAIDKVREYIRYLLKRWDTLDP